MTPNFFSNSAMENYFSNDFSIAADENNDAEYFMHVAELNFVNSIAAENVWTFCNIYNAKV